VLALEGTGDINFGERLQPVQGRELPLRGKLSRPDRVLPSEARAPKNKNRVVLKFYGMAFYSRNIITLIVFIPILLGLILSPVLFFTIAKATSFSTSVTVTLCGNNVKEGSEDCDGSDLGGATCVSLGYTGGSLSCNSDCTFNTSNCTSEAPPPPPSGVGGIYVPPPTVTKVIIKGKAYPESKITLLEDGKVLATKKADTLADFEIEIADITAGIWTFGIWAEDKDGRKSITFSFTTSVTEGMTTTVSNIFVPPTIELSKVSFQKGETLNIFGQTAPESEVSISVESPEIVKKTIATEEGDWDYSFDASILDEGSYTARAKATSPEGLLSSYSKALDFYIGKGVPGVICPNADLNGEGKVNLIDFSILLYWWGKDDPCSDQNGNGRVDLPDFSIMMYHWTG